MRSEAVFLSGLEEVIVSRGALTEELNRVAKEKGFKSGDLRPSPRCLEPAGSSTARQAINELNVDLLVIPIEKK